MDAPNIPKANTKATPSKRKQAGNDEADTPSKRNKIGTCFEELSEGDKLMVTMKEQGKPWAEIVKAWTKETKRPANAGLRTRLDRVLRSLARIDDSDVDALQAAIKQTHEDIDQEKKALDKQVYAKAAEHMAAAGTKKYDAAVLEKEAKRLFK